MKTDKIVDSKVTIMTDLGGKKTKVLYLKDEIEIEAFKEQLRIANVSVSLPTKDEVVSEGYRIANDAGYNYRRVLKEPDHDIYYSGWMDCFDWISKGNER